MAKKRNKDTPMDDRRYCFVIGCGLVECEDHEEATEKDLANEALANPDMFGIRMEYHDAPMDVVMAVQARCAEVMPILVKKLLADGMSSFKMRGGSLKPEQEEHLRKILDTEK